MSSARYAEIFSLPHLVIISRSRGNINRQLKKENIRQDGAYLNTLVSEWLVGVCPAHVLHRNIDASSVRIRVGAGTQVGALDGLVGVGSFLSGDTLVIAVARVWRAARAAADAKYPE